MAKQEWLTAADQYDQSEASQQARWKKEREEDAERRKQQEQLNREIKEAAGQLQEWMRTDEYQAALRLLSSGGEWDYKSVYLGREKTGEKTCGYERRTTTEHVAAEGPEKEFSYFLQKDGFDKSYTPWHFTYHGECEPGDSIDTPASPEEVVRAIVTTHGKKPSEALAFIQEGLDKIAQEASKQKA